MYPQTGNDVVDALHYSLDLTWRPATRTLIGREVVTLRAARAADALTLDLAAHLRVRSVRLDGRRVAFRHGGAQGDALVVPVSVRADSLHRLKISYRGRPHNVRSGPAAGAGIQINRRGELQTCQPPFGAYTWYAVNDAISDKAYYDFRLRVRAPWTGVANGQLRGRRVVDGTTHTRWHLDQPASPYLVVLGFGDYRRVTLGNVGGTPLTLWVPPGRARVAARLSYLAPAMRWVERRLGPYPFDSLGILSTRGTGCGMETQTMITLGASNLAPQAEYLTSKEVVLHELVHQWYGDLTTPRDWHDLWMSEGMAYYLQLAFRARQDHRSLDDVIADQVPSARASRREYGPPVDSDPEYYASINNYDGPAIMWHQLRKRLGDREFWRLVRRWPHVHAIHNADRDQLASWFSRRSGQDLRRFFHRWLYSPKLPPLH